MQNKGLYKGLVCVWILGVLLFLNNVVPKYAFADNNVSIQVTEENKIESEEVIEELPTEEDTVEEDVVEEPIDKEEIVKKFIDSGIILKINSSDILINSKKERYDSKNIKPMAFIKSGTTFVPFRYISEKLNGLVSWDNDTKSIVLSVGETEVKLAPNNREIIVNGEIVEISKAPFIEEGTTFIPIRDIANVLGNKVYWIDGGFIILSPDEIDIDEYKEMIKSKVASEFKDINKPVIKPEPPKNNNVNVGNVDKLVKSSEVIATINKNVSYYSDKTKKKVLGSFAKGEKVQIIIDNSREWYYVKGVGNKKIGWITRGYLNIPQDPPTNKNKMTKDQILTYVNSKDFSSKTNYFMWVDIDRQITHVFKGKNKSWQLVKSMDSATGRNTSPTKRGLFTIKERGNVFYTKSQSGAKNWVRFDGPYLFHSVVINRKGNIIDYTLGKRASQGCIRLSMDNSKWVFDTIPRDTLVFVN